MSLEGLAALMLMAVAGLAFALLKVRQLGSKLAVVDADIERAIAAAAERDARLKTLEQALQTQQLAEQAVATGTALVREVHKGIADIPFSVLDAIPATRVSAKALRGLHDSISDGVYGAIAGLNKAVGRELRKGASLPPERSTPVDSPKPEALSGAPSSPAAVAEPTTLPTEPPQNKDKNWG